MNMHRALSLHYLRHPQRHPLLSDCILDRPGLGIVIMKDAWPLGALPNGESMASGNMTSPTETFVMNMRPQVIKECGVQGIKSPPLTNSSSRYSGNLGTGGAKCHKKLTEARTLLAHV
jgi:hypothetical protein